MAPTLFLMGKRLTRPTSDAHEGHQKSLKYITGKWLPPLQHELLRNISNAQQHIMM